MDEDLTLRIHRRAYELWEQEGRPQGKELDHWCRAEAELNAKQSSRVGQAGEPPSEGAAEDRK